ncbi:hypothetical protein KKE60_08200 [Patescibacteria group bacterium]|nr:hypothetical protein [Patescibacteria group bacterium]
MSKLYLTTKTDTVKKEKTSRANKNISVAMGFDPLEKQRKIYATMTRDEKDNLKLEIEYGHRHFLPLEKILVCTGTVKNGLTECDAYGIAKKMLGRKPTRPRAGE